MTKMTCWFNVFPRIGRWCSYCVATVVWITPHSNCGTIFVIYNVRWAPVGEIITLNTFKSTHLKSEVDRIRRWNASKATKTALRSQWHDLQDCGLPPAAWLSLAQQPTSLLCPVWTLLFTSRSLPWIELLDAERWTICLSWHQFSLSFTATIRMSSLQSLSIFYLEPEKVCSSLQQIERVRLMIDNYSSKQLAEIRKTNFCATYRHSYPSSNCFSY